MPPPLDLPEWFEPADEEHVRREKNKARELRRSQWWKNICGRGRCQYCGEKVPPRELTMDHVVPIVRGGLTRRGNVVPCCKRCNEQKKYLLPVEWQDYLQHLRGKKTLSPEKKPDDVPGPKTATEKPKEKGKKDEE